MGSKIRFLYKKKSKIAKWIVSFPPKEIVWQMAFFLQSSQDERISPRKNGKKGPGPIVFLASRLPNGPCNTIVPPSPSLFRSKNILHPPPTRPSLGRVEWGGDVKYFLNEKERGKGAL